MSKTNNPVNELVHHQAIINGINMHYVEQGQGVPVILCHGFPHTWYSWHKQIPALAQAGYRVHRVIIKRIGQKELSTGEPDCRLFTFFSRLAQASVQALYKAV